MSNMALSDHPVVLTDGEVPGGAVAGVLGRSGPSRWHHREMPTVTEQRDHMPDDNPVVRERRGGGSTLGISMKHRRFRSIPFPKPGATASQRLRTAARFGTSTESFPRPRSTSRPTPWPSRSGPPFARGLLAAYKYPRRIYIAKAATGKIKRGALRSV